MPEVSDKATKKATGKTYNEWFVILDKAGADRWPHKQIAKFLYDSGYIQKPKEWPANRSFSVGWWCQSVTVAYEKARGLRVLGQTKDSGFEIGVQKTLPISVSEAWGLITSKKGLKIWLGDIDQLKLKPKETYQTKDGLKGQIRSVYTNERLRLTWQPKDWPAPSTLQIYLMPAGSKTSVRFHQEKLADAEARERMKQHWQTVIEKLNGLVDKNRSGKHYS